MNNFNNKIKTNHEQQNKTNHETTDNNEQP